MTLDALIMGAGAFIAVLPFLGFPESWDNVLFFLAGAFVIALGIVVRRRGTRIVMERSRPRGFEESRPVQAQPTRHEEIRE